jgi:hypothetical protein
MMPLKHLRLLNVKAYSLALPAALHCPSFKRFFWLVPHRPSFASLVTDKITQAVKTTPHIYKGKGATLIPGTVKLLHQQNKRKDQWGSGRLHARPETGS